MIPLSLVAVKFLAARELYQNTPLDAESFSPEQEAAIIEFLGDTIDVGMVVQLKSHESRARVFARENAPRFERSEIGLIIAILTVAGGKFPNHHYNVHLGSLELVEPEKLEV